MRLFLALCAVGIAAATWRVNAPLVEGYLFPVVQPATISQIEPSEARGRAWSRIWGESIRVRDCTFLRAQFQYRASAVPSDAVVTPHIFLEEAKVRPKGSFDFGPWLVHQSREQFREGAYAYVWHRCHPFWPTRSLFYDARATTTP